MGRRGQVEVGAEQDRQVEGGEVDRDHTAAERGVDRDHGVGEEEVDQDHLQHCRTPALVFLHRHPPCHKLDQGQSEVVLTRVHLAVIRPVRIKGGMEGLVKVDLINKTAEQIQWVQVALINDQAMALIKEAPVVLLIKEVLAAVPLVVILIREDLGELSIRGG